MRLKTIQKALLVALGIILIISTILVTSTGIPLWIALLWTILNMLGADFPPDLALVDAPDPLLLFAFALDILGSIIVTIFLTTILYQVLSRIDIQRLLSKRKSSKLKSHFILNPINSFSISFAKNLQSHNMPFIFIDKDRAKITKALSMSMLAIDGNPTQSIALKDANIAKAKALFLFGEEPIENVLTTITAKKMNDGIKILSRVKTEAEIPRMSRAGIDHIIMPEFAVGEEMSLHLLDAFHTQK